MSKRRRLLRIVLGLGGGGLALSLAAIVGGGVWLTTPAGNDFLRGVIEDQVSDLMPLGSLKIGRLQSDLLSYIELSEVTLHRWDGDTMVTIPRIRLEHELPLLTQKAVPLHSLQIDAPDVRIEQVEDGQLDLLIAFGVTDEPSTEPPTAWAGLDWLITLDEAKLTGGRVTLVSPESEQVIEDISLHTALSVGGGRQAALTDLSLHAAVAGYAPADLTGTVRYDTGNLLIDSLSLGYDQSRVGVSGTIHQVELDMALGLEVSLEPLAAGQLSQWTNDNTPSTEVTAALSVRGPLSGLEITGAMSTAEAGQVALTGGLDLTAEPMAWSLVASTDRLDLDAILPPVTEPVRLVGQYSLSGTGTTWPTGIAARLEVEAGEQILWGEPVSGLSFGADLAGGRLTIEHLIASHPVGSLGLTGGWVDLVSEKASLHADVAIPSLAALSRFQVTGYSGSLSAVGPVEVDWSADPVRVDVFPILSGSGIRGEGFSFGAIDSQALQVTLVGEEVAFQGGVGVGDIDVAGLKVDRVDLGALSGGWSAKRGVSFRTDVRMGRMLVGDGTFELSGLSGPISGSVPTNGRPDLETELMLGELTLLPADYKIDGGPVTLKLRENGLEVGLSLTREERVVIKAQTHGDLETGTWRVEELALFPISGRGMVTQQEIPIRFTLNDRGVDNVELVLVVSDDPTPSRRSLDEAAYISMSGGTAGDEPDLNLKVRRLPLPWISDVLNTFLSEDGVPFIVPLQGMVGGEVSLRGLSGEADLTGDVLLTELTWPEVATDITVKADFSGKLRQPGARIRLSDADGLLLALEGSVPLDLDASSLDCDADIALRGLLAPGELSRLERAFPSATGLSGLGSADVHITGPACDPQMNVVGAVSLPIGARGEHMRVDLRLEREGEVINILATADENMVRRFKLSGTASNRFSQVIGDALSGEEPPDYADPATWISSVGLNLVPLAVPLQSMTALFGLPDGLTGRLAGGVSLMGPLEHLQVAGGLLWVEGSIGAVPLQVANLNMFPETNEETGVDGYHLMGALDFGDQGNLSLDGFIPLTLARLREEEELEEDEGEVSLKIEGEGVPMAVLNGVVDGVTEASGRVNISGTVGGSIAAPRPRLRFQITDGGLAYRPLGLRYSDINFDVRLLDSRLILKEASISSQPLLGLSIDPLKAGPGTLKGTGNVLMEGFRPSTVSIDLSAESFWLASTTEYTAAVRGDMSITGEYPTLGITGDVALTEGRFVFDDSFFMDDQSLSLDPGITIYRKEETLQTVVTQREPSELEKNLTIDLGVDLNRSLRMAVDMPLLDTYGGQISSLSTVSVVAEMDGELDVGYRGGALSIHGTVETLAGSTTRLFDTSFSVTDGSAVYFVGDDYANPILKLEAVHTTSRYGDVNVTISGSAEDPEVALSADEYDDTDILFLLLFGKPASEMSEGESGAGSLLLTTAVASLSGQVSRAVGGTLIDEFDWDPESGVRVGKALSEKLFIAYDRNTNPEDDENINQITLEWIITRRMYAQFMTGDMAQSSADLYWRWLF